MFLNVVDFKGVRARIRLSVRTVTKLMGVHRPIPWLTQTGVAAGVAISPWSCGLSTYHSRKNNLRLIAVQRVVPADLG